MGSLDADWITSRERLFDVLRAQLSTIEDIAASGLYKVTRTVAPRNASLCWARHHVAALRAQGKVFVAKGTGHRGDPRRFSVSCRHPFSQRVHLGNAAACCKCGLQEDVHR